MAFSEDTIIQAWVRCGGRCECRRSNHDHASERCPKRLEIANRGRAGDGAWEAHTVNAAGGDGLSNCEILCWSCLRQARRPAG